MDLLFVCPAKEDDENVHNIARHRVNLVNAFISYVVAGKSTTPDPADQRYFNFLADIEKHVGKITDVKLLVLPRLEDALDGTYKSHRLLQGSVVPSIASILETETKSGDVLVHVDLGNSMASLYAAYIAAGSDAPLSVCFHAPPEGVQFAVGGLSAYGKQRAMLRRHLAERVVRNADHIFVDVGEIAAALGQHLFPRIARGYSVDPLVGEKSPPAPETLSS